MSNNYNFDEAVKAESPEIIMGGYTFRLQYPTLADIEKIQTLKTDAERAEVMYSFVKNTKDGDPPFQDVLRNQDVRVLKKFGQMLETEFGVED